MAEWPATGTEGWNTVMLAYLAVEHNTDGTHDIHDTEGGYMQVDVNGVKTNVYTKYFTGNLTDGAGNTNVAHGVDSSSDILSVTVAISSQADANLFYVYDNRSAQETDVNFQITYNNSNITISNRGTLMDSTNAYRIKVDYVL